MKPKVLLLATIDGIKPEGDYDASDQIDQFYYFVNDPSIVVPQLIADQGEDFRKAIGKINFNSISKSSAAVFSRIDFNNQEVLKRFFEKYPPNSLLDAFLFKLFNFLQFLWLVKDSSVMVGDIYFVSHDSLNLSKPLSCFWSCTGEATPAVFQREEIKKAICTSANYRTSQNKQKLSTLDKSILPGAFQTDFIKSKSRLERAFLMLHVVRESKDLALKVAHYCSCFEILFSSSTDNEGISHQLATRMAFFLSVSIGERVEVYDDVREAYRVRCAIFHGTFLGPKRQEELKRICVRCDDLLRKTLCRILMSSEFADLFAAGEKQFDQYFKDLILGVYEVGVKS